MAYIEPNSVIQLLSGCPLDRGYKNTIYFKTLLEQANYFQSLQEVTLTKSSYQRWDDGVIHVNFPADVCLRCNYMMFQNTAYSDKWFYAFIDSVDYVNNNCTKISFTIDVMQTWYFNYNILPSFVEREHTLTDEIYENTIDEDLDVNASIANQEIYKTWNNGLDDMCLVIQYIAGSAVINSVSYDPDGVGWGDKYKVDYTLLYDSVPNPDYGTSYLKYDFKKNFFQGYRTYGFRIGNIVDEETERILLMKILRAIEFITEYTYSSLPAGRILNIFLCPYTVYNHYESSEQYISDFRFVPTISFRYRNKLDYFVPKNKKLYNYPYKYLNVYNNAGESCDYTFEDFLDGICRFSIIGFLNGGCQMQVVPFEYKGETSNYSESLILEAFPEVSWDESSFGKWWAQNKEAFVLGSIMNVMQIVGPVNKVIPVKTRWGGYSGGVAEFFASLISNPMQYKDRDMRGNIIENSNVDTSKYTKLSDGFNTITGMIGTLTSQQKKPNTAHGSPSSNVLSYINGVIGFTFKEMSITAEEAKIIDDYFSMFGYAIKQLKIPNIKNPDVENQLRPTWNYVKTKDCHVEPIEGNGMPASFEEAISDIYNNGITFWMNPDTIGDYSRDNSPATISTTT